MQVNRINSNPSFGVKIPTTELIGFVCNAPVTENKFASAAQTITKLTNGKTQALHLNALNLHHVATQMGETIKTKFPQIADAARKVDNYAKKLTSHNTPMNEYLGKIERRLRAFNKSLGEEFDIKDFENTTWV